MRSSAIDILKIILAILIVLLHTNIFHLESKYINFTLINGFFRIAVPIFLIITGYYFHRISSLFEIKTWCKRLGLLYIVWMTIYAPIWFKFIDNIPKLLTILFLGHHHLWYIIGTLYACIILYILRKKNTSFLITFATISYLISYVTQLLTIYYPEKIFLADQFYHLYMYRNFISICLPFLIIGYLIKRYDLGSKLKKINYFVPLAFLILFSESYYLYKIPTATSIDLLLSLPFASTVIFLSFIKLDFRLNTSQISNLSTGIYVVHIYVILIFEKYNIINNNSILRSLLILFFSIILALIILKVSQRYKFLL